MDQRLTLTLTPNPRHTMASDNHIVSVTKVQMILICAYVVTWEIFGAGSTSKFPRVLSSRLAFGHNATSGHCSSPIQDHANVHTYVSVAYGHCEPIWHAILTDDHLQRF